MLSIAALNECPNSADFISPSAHPFKVRVSATSYRYEPYKVARRNSATSTDSVAPKVIDVEAAPVSSKPRYAHVEFKHESKQFLAPFRITNGDTVIVEGDRGENIGVVRGISTDEPTTCSGKIVRRATKDDHETLTTQRDKESDATTTIQTLAKTLRLNGEVVDTEYQFDRNKLTVFVRRAEGAFVDFRKLQRTLYHQFHCRIWCAYMDEVEF